MERQKRENKERELRVLEKFERQKREAIEKDKLEWAEFERRRQDKMAREASEKKILEGNVEEALHRRLASSGFMPSQIEEILKKEKAKEQDQRAPAVPEYTAEEEAKLSDDAMMRFTGRVIEPAVDAVDEPTLSSEPQR